MKIGIDVRPLQLQHSVRGIGKHAQALVVEMLDSKRDEDELIFFLYEGMPDPIEKLRSSSSTPYRIVHLKNFKDTKSRLPSVISGSINLLRRVAVPLPSRLVRQCDVLLAFDFMNGMPKRRDTKYILIAYDLIPLMFKKEYFPPFRANLKGSGLIHAVHSAFVYGMYRYALHLIKRRKYRLLSISDSTKEQFVKYLKIKPSLIRTVHLGNPLASTEFKMNHEELERVKEFTKGSYILFVGGNDPRRRIEDVIHAFNQVRGRGHKLRMVFAGFDFQSLDTIVSYNTKKAIETSSYNNDIHLLGYINDSEKKYLYENALCFAFPSISEGFGLPILEAMQEGCPVIAYDYPLSSMKEVAGGAAILTDPGMDPVYDALILLLTNKDQRANLIELGLKNCERFGWDKCAKETVANILDSKF